MSRHLTASQPRAGSRGLSDFWTLISRRFESESKAASRIPDDWRQRLPDPASYYAQHVAKLGRPKSSGYAVGLCPFHDDHNPSFGVKLTSGRGHWCCYSGCGKGDMVEFHQRVTGLDFRAAVRELLEVR